MLVLANRARERTRSAGLGQSGRLDVGVFGSNILAIPQLLATRSGASFLDVDVVVHAMNKEKQLEALYDRLSDGRIQPARVEVGGHRQRKGSG